MTAEDVAPPLPRLSLRDPLPPVIEDAAALRTYCDAVAAGSGPVALDAERASGYRYSQRAYLVQVRREGAGTALIDPIATGDLTALDDAIGDTEWILHAATQDLACLAEVGLRPRRLFDTEHAGRLLNLPRVGLASLVEHYLDHSLAKEHSAADWSTRPLPEPWLVYAALDVEVLIEIRDFIEADLEKAGKTEWAAQDFEALLSFTGAPVREEPWRRTSGIHQVRGRRGLGLVREIWEARDAIAAERDVTPGRILPDSSILEMARNPPANTRRAQADEGHAQPRPAPFHRASGRTPSIAAWPCPRPSCLGRPRDVMARLHRAPGPRSSPRPHGGSAAAAKPSPRCPWSTTSRRRTC